MSVLAYVKILEMMIRRAKESGAMDALGPDIQPPERDDYSGSMFG